MPLARRPWFAAAALVAVLAVARHANSAAPSVPEGAAKPAAASVASKPPVFETEVRPILKAHCFHCHGEEDDLQAGLDVRLVRLLNKGGESGPAIVAGKHAESLLFQRIADDEMPPGEKKLSPAERATIARWIDGGAKTARPEPQTISQYTDEDRTFWSFQPIARPALPRVRNAAQVHTPVDAFLLAELEKKQLTLSPEADPTALVRRLYFDLLGLPPTPEEVDEFVSDYSPSLRPSVSPSSSKDEGTHGTRDRERAYEALVDKLLASPHYGERWGRHWLDIAGYADSDGYTPLDPERKYAWRYRDYVIRSFNADKPWNEFIVEQLAGDELVKPPYAELPPAELDKLIATGFLRMGPDGTGDTSADQKLARNDCMAETIKIVSTSFLGLSVGCAQCHNHRYDPILQADYYRFRAIFEPAYDVENWRNPNGRLLSTTTAADKKKIVEIDAQIAKVNAERLKELNKLQDEVFEMALAKLPENIREPVRKARATAADKQTAEQKKLLKDNPSVNVNATGVRQQLPAKFREWEKKYTDLGDALRAKRPAESNIQALTEVPGKIPATFVFYRGDHTSPREKVNPAELGVLAADPTKMVPEDDPKLPTTGRRLAYARHLVDGKHPLTARVLVNRFWLHHFGRGLVASPGDFGMLGERPTHPELLDWLAAEFMDGGWRLKKLHKTILMSAAYRQSSARSDKLDATDPDNLLLGRMSIRRLEAELLRDAVLAASGKLNRKLFGEPVPVMPDDTGQVVIGVDTRDTAGRPTGKKVDLGDQPNRRSIYIQSRRTLPLGMLETFDAPTMSPNCEVRASSTVTPQSLLLMNNEFVVAQSDEFARRLRTAAPDDLPAQIKLGWRIAFGGSPSDRQIAESLAFVAEQTQELSAAAPAPPAAKPAAGIPAPPSPPTPAERALACYCQALLSANGFLYVD